ncbi:leucyl aminopeptidase [Mangrovicoccus algicola]|uniref:Probable cytosol aminopeptidase n=1 Tax=Mangrovicoccus algicola TaxID=2771008 RepID=A0A8J6Z8G6_9RHOB|nr:leucyl aminopeptidase [Mangrovicoccus algicola]MBE3637766.1 leucyl aminopeptidase [Mangrovicoccus algicola]
MTTPVNIHFQETDLDTAATFEGRVVTFVTADGRLDQPGRRVNRLCRGALERAVASPAFEALSPGEALEMGFPAGMRASALQVVKLGRRPRPEEARAAGSAIARAKGGKPVLVLAGAIANAAEIAFALALRSYGYSDMKSKPADPEGAVTVMVSRPEAVAAAAKDQAALCEGVFFARDLTSAPANVLGTLDFAAQLAAMQELGLEVEILGEEDLARLGMRLVLAVGQGSASPSRVVVMRWNGGGEEAPLALVGKGVVFDTGGISLKPAQGMEEMTMDMGGAGVVAGVMRALALRQAGANVIGLVGLVENMPSHMATRPGDVVRSMKGDTVEINNTDAEGRLVLADVLWHAQEAYKPAAIVDLATLTGAAVVALGHEMAAVYSNDDGFAGSFLAAAAAEGEGAWRMPLGPGYDRMIKSSIADIKNSAGRAAGSVTAAQFLQRFVREGTPWIHLDIAGVAAVKTDTVLSPRGCTGWGVLALDRLIRDRFEG